MDSKLHAMQIQHLLRIETEEQFARRREAELAHTRVLSPLHVRHVPDKVPAEQ